MSRGQLPQHTEQLHPDSIVSFPVCLTDSEQKGCLVLGAICIMRLGSSGALYPRGAFALPLPSPGAPDITPASCCTAGFFQLVLV